MMNPLSMFREKDEASGAEPFSMTRTVAFFFAVTICASLVRYAWSPQQIGWPFATLGIVTLMAVPLQAMFKMLQRYLTSRPGEALLQKLVEHFVPAIEAVGQKIADKVTGASTSVKESAPDAKPLARDHLSHEG